MAEKNKYPITLIILKKNGSFREITNLFGKKIITKKKEDFVIQELGIKLPFTRKKKKLGYLPDMSLSSANNRLYFIDDGDSWKQCDTDIIEYKQMNIEVEDQENGGTKIEEITYNLVSDPISTDIKTATINNLHDAENLLIPNKLKATTIAIGALLLMALVHVLFLFLASK